MIQLNMQDANSPIMENLSFFHDNTMMILIMITMMVMYLMMTMMWNKFINHNLLENQFIEIIWTILPMFMLMFIALPSLKILYLMDEIKNPMLTIKAIGHQWYWSYEYSDFKNINFDSYMTPDMNLKLNEFRLLDVDNRMILPTNSKIRMLITATDVIHAWTIPILNIKLDAIPGRLNQSMILIKKPTIMYGQCSEICGTNHSFMPITIEAIPNKYFIKWLNSQ
uniref:Cytochrome c oxidase subunit 2 n=1 Tax=Stenopirates sp. HL-2011 TaxID=1085627 RepID=G3K2K7_9HEMI|nr:cytochrome c oxidase subunit II [Stenopirates sp. HL-2011]AEK26844.1 cytochrome c oxidase subunit II [Stenopirates sp. HL-2011]